jgi:hypothetical protein
MYGPINISGSGIERTEVPTALNEQVRLLVAPALLPCQIRIPGLYSLHETL